MMNLGELKTYFINGRRREDVIGVPRRVVVEDEDRQALARTFLRTTLTQHDRKYHKGRYKEGDKCNFREALKRGDSADELVAAEEREEHFKVGLIKFRVDPKTGHKVVLGIEEIKKVSVDGPDGEPVKVAGLDDGRVGISDDGEVSDEDASLCAEDALAKYLALRMV